MHWARPSASQVITPNCGLFPAHTRVGPAELELVLLASMATGKYLDLLLEAWASGCFFPGSGDLEGVIAKRLDLPGAG